MTRNCETKRGEVARKIRQLQNICCRKNKFVAQRIHQEWRPIIILQKGKKERKKEIQRFQEKKKSQKMESDLAELRKDMEEKKKIDSKGESHVRSKRVMMVIVAISVQLGKLKSV